MNRHLILQALLAPLFAVTAFAFGGGGAGTPAPYQGPCDMTVTCGCAEAYSVDRAMKASYSGNLFQLVLGSNHSLTLDVGQNSTTHLADMTTWSSFCGGTASNCIVEKIYAQISTGSNDLVPTSVLPTYGPNCTASAYACAATFAIDSATGLPKILVGTGTNSDTTNPAPQYNIGGADTAATGVSSGNSSASVMMNATTTTYNQCCGTFGKSHKYNAGDTPGTDFLVYTQYGTYTGSGGPYGCQPSGTSVNHCAYIDTEAGVPSSGNDMQFRASGNIDIVHVGTHDASANTFEVDVNGAFAIGSIVSGTWAPPNYIHLGGGGDLSNPAAANWREGALWNCALSAGDQGAVIDNERAAFPAVNFPNPP